MGAEDVLARRSAAVRESEERYGPDHLETAVRRTGLAMALAVRVRTAVLGPTDPATIQAQRVLVGVLVRDEEWDRVAALYPGLIAAERAVLGPRADRTLGARVNHAISLRRSGRSADAEAELREVLPVCVENLGDGHVVTEACRAALAR
jgi:hypothetical protein